MKPFKGVNLDSNVFTNRTSTIKTKLHCIVRGDPKQQKLNEKCFKVFYIKLSLTLIIRAAIVASAKSLPNDRKLFFLSAINGNESIHDRNAVSWFLFGLWFLVEYLEQNEKNLPWFEHVHFIITHSGQIDTPFKVLINKTPSQA